MISPLSTTLNTTQVSYSIDALRTFFNFSSRQNNPFIKSSIQHDKFTKMPTALRQDKDNRCGLSIWHPPWMLRFANTKMFMAVYGLLGTIQAMSYMYFIVTLTTIEKRFKIPSQTTGECVINKKKKNIVK